MKFPEEAFVGYTKDTEWGASYGLVCGVVELCLKFVFKDNAEGYFID